MAVQQGWRLIDSGILRNELLWEGCLIPELFLNMEHGKNNVSESSIYSTAGYCAECVGCITDLAVELQGDCSNETGLF